MAIKIYSQVMNPTYRSTLLELKTQLRPIVTDDSGVQTPLTFLINELDQFQGELFIDLHKAIKEVLNLSES